MSEIVYLNGKFLPKNEAFITPEDRGFNFADGVYEVIKYYKGKPFYLDDHVNRLKYSLQEVRINFDKSEGLPGVFQELLNKNNLNVQDAGIYLQITRGSYQRMHRFPEKVTPTIYAFAFSFPSKTEYLNNGIKVITTEDIRWLRCDIKSISLLPNVMLLQKAIEDRAGEVIFIRNGIVTEASHSNVLCVKNKTVYTHPNSNLILPGITKKVVLEICHANGINVIEDGVPEHELKKMDEVMIVGTSCEVTPVVDIDDMKIGNGQPGSITKFIQDKFFEQTK